MNKALPQYIVDTQGRKTAVVLPVKEYDRLLERIEELEGSHTLGKDVESCQGFADYFTVRPVFKK